ncbi:glyoxalase/bleomycin resistance protein/dioxygenase superfamily protein [Streptohalobacillus salinus]|uniref:Glyoxalase/bleomycin resistance protein/dioxygenase superfamily protein n=1 Tax=Streptohalobacillus salinus TaxID=621096 RepID=A0A2V3WG88_9BACI|nr:VOC family protein [Streptohalobacillus salinus]PXW92447.1 glyoxalase/bleomycin resistance protein/dioxygenase superfamily protein [Streptohalobacillus salinus]
MSEIFDSKLITQIAIIVHDIERVKEAYANLFNMTPPDVVVTDDVEQAKTTYRGESTPARAKLCFFDFGQVQLELIEPDQHPSTWREYLDEHGEGVHHIAFQVKGMNETVKRLTEKGMPEVQKGEYEGGRYSYIDSEGPLKVILELLENDEVDK